MLVVTRKPNQTIMIGDQIEVVILGIENGQVRVGIRAPRHVEVVRKELLESIQTANQEAATVLPEIVTQSWKLSNRGK